MVRGSANRERPGFRFDVEGLRAVAILGVVADHAGIPWLRGGYVGVDVFFVISGFLITRLLVGELRDSGEISLVRFYARRVRRLLPLAATVLLLVGLASILIMGPVRRQQIPGDIVAASLFFINWRFHAQALNYFASSVNASPLMHFWSLSLEEQFYIVWPGLLLAATWWHRRRGRSLVRPLWVAVSLLGLASFAYGVYATMPAGTTAGAAFGGGGHAGIYFSTLARGWELALGGMVALSVGALARLPRRLAQGLGVIGAAAILVAMLVYSGATTFPGVAALLPTLGTAAIIAGGQISPLRPLRLGPVRYVGRISYSWYLWHWPMIVFAGVLFGPLSALAGVAVVLVSLVPTIVSHHLLEQPLRRARRLVPRPRLTLALGGVGATTVLAMSAVVTITTQSGAAAKSAPRSAVSFRALNRTRHRHIQLTASRVRPAPDRANDDRGPIPATGCFLNWGTVRSPSCVFGDHHSHTTVVLFGDSHAMQYSPAILPVARRRHWRLVVLTKSGCSPAEIHSYRPCNRWRDNTLPRIIRMHPTLVVMSSALFYKSESKMRSGWLQTLRRLHRAHIATALVRDGPVPTENVPDCVARNMKHLKRCLVPRKDLEPPSDVEAARRMRVPVINPIPLRCLRIGCPAVISNALVYRKEGHLTATYVETMTHWFGRQLARVLRHRSR